MFASLVRDSRELGSQVLAVPGKLKCYTGYKTLSRRRALFPYNTTTPVGMWSNVCVVFVLGTAIIPASCDSPLGDLGNLLGAFSQLAEEFGEECVHKCPEGRSQRIQECMASK